MAGTAKSGRRRRVRIVEFDITCESVRQCAVVIEGSVSGISDVLNGKRKTHKGYHFEDPDKEKT